MRTKNMIRNSLIQRPTLKKLFSVSVIACLTLGCIGLASAGSMEQARRMHDRLTGVPPTSGLNPVLETMAGYIDGSLNSGIPAPEEAAKIAIIPDYLGVSNGESVKAFYSTSLKNFITPWTNIEQSVHAPLNDYTATVIGIIRDGLPFTEVLYGNYIYIGVGDTYSADNNTNYETLENTDADLSSSSVLELRTQAAAGMPGAAEAAGVITTRAAGMSFFRAGTNRRMWRFTSMNYLCRDLEQMKDTTGVPDRIRQDVSRSPGGDSSIFLNSCIGCHIGMDPLTGAYAHFEFNDPTPDEDNGDGSVTYNPANPTTVDGHKYLINSGNFEHGYVTTDNSWENYWRTGPNAKLNWGWGVTNNPNLVLPNPGSGSGPASLGKEVAASEAFAQCQVEKVYKFVCLQDPKATDAGQLATITTAFRDGGYDLREVFADVAPMCMGD